jgi:hypothetical protein
MRKNPYAMNQVAMLSAKPCENGKGRPEAQRDTAPPKKKTEGGALRFKRRLASKPLV